MNTATANEHRHRNMNAATTNERCHRKMNTAATATLNAVYTVNSSSPPPQHDRHRNMNASFYTANEIATARTTPPPQHEHCHRK
jgi:hypothetical protein